MHSARQGGGDFMTGLVQTSLLRGDWVLIFVSSNCYSGVIQPLDLSSLPDGRSIALPIGFSLIIFLIYNINYLWCLCIDLYDLSAWCGCWFVVYTRKLMYRFFKCLSCLLHGSCGDWEGWARKPVNHTSSVAVVTQTDRPKSARNLCVIESLWRYLCCYYPFDISFGIRDFVIGLSQIHLFLSLF